MSENSDMVPHFVSQKQHKDSIEKFDSTPDNPTIQQFFGVSHYTKV